MGRERQGLRSAARTGRLSLTLSSAPSWCEVVHSVDAGSESLNLWCRHGDWAKRRSVLRDCFRALRPDLVMLQETVVDGNGDQVREAFGNDYHVNHQGRRTADGVGCSLVSRWQPTGVDEQSADDLPADDSIEPFTE